MRYSLVPIGLAPIEPVTVDEAKRQCRVELDFHGDDEDLSGYIATVRQQIENETGRQLMRRSYALRMDAFPSLDRFCLPMPPLIDVTIIEYVDVDGVTQTWDDANYLVDPYSDPGVITLAEGVSWPSTKNIRNAVTVTYRNGYGASADNLPWPYRHAIRLGVAHMYRYRELDVKTVSDIVDRLLGTYRRAEVLVA